MVRTVGFHPTDLGSIPSGGVLFSNIKNHMEEKNTSYSFFSNIFSSISNFLLNTIEAIIIALALSIVLYLFIATPHEVVGESMYPNFQNGEYLIGNKLTYRFNKPERGDIIIYEYNEQVDYIKRIIGLPGENISLQNGQIYINDKKLDESSYLDNSIKTRGGDKLPEGEEINIPLGHYFTLGDNRPESYDSRSFGTIKEEQIKGKAYLVYFPFSNFRIMEHPEVEFKE